jgi:hypothetical protein
MGTFYRLQVSFACSWEAQPLAPRLGFLLFCFASTSLYLYHQTVTRGKLRLWKRGCALIVGRAFCSFIVKPVSVPPGAASTISEHPKSSRLNSLLGLDGFAAALTRCL